MKILFVHDHVFKRYKGNYYSDGKITSRMWDRYKVTQDVSISVLCRYRDISDEADLMKLNISSATNVNFKCVDNYFDVISFSGFSRFFAEVSGADKMVVRLPSFMGVFACFVRLLSGKAYGVEVVGDAYDSLWYGGSLKGKIFALLFCWLNKYFIFKSRVAVFVTKCFLQRRYPTSGEMYAASNVEINVPADISLQKMLHKYKTVGEGRPLRIGFVGSLNNKYKGLDYLLEAVQMLDFEFCLEVVGSGSSLPIYISKYKNDVRYKFLGSLKGGEDMFSWYESLDFYIHPSLTEGLPRSLIEAMSRGVVCIGSNVGGIPELLPVECLFKSKSSKAISELLNGLYHKIDDLELYAFLNFNRSRFYDLEKLEAVRNKAWESYIFNVER